MEPKKHYTRMQERLASYEPHNPFRIKPGE